MLPDPATIAKGWNRRHLAQAREEGSTPPAIVPLGPPAEALRALQVQDLQERPVLPPVLPEVHPPRLLLGSEHGPPG